jgi:hypothetical protein
MKMSVAYLLTTLVLGAATAKAQTISLLDVKVTDLRPMYEVGKSIKLTPVGRPPESLHVRVFFDSIERLKRTRPDRDHCIPFYTNILWGTGYPNEINLDAISNRSVVSHGPTTVTLVFEAGTQPEPGAFRLKRESLDAYFRYAIEINLAPSSDQQSVDRKVTEAVVNGIRESHPAVFPTPASAPASTPPAPPCFDVNPHPTNSVTNESEGIGVTFVATVALTSCTEQPVAPSANSAPAGF